MHTQSATDKLLEPRIVYGESVVFRMGLLYLLPGTPGCQIVAAIVPPIQQHGVACRPRYGKYV